MKEKTVEVWFGEMEFGQISFGTDPASPITVVHSIHEKRWMDPDDNDIEDYAKGADWVIPSQFEGDLVFSQTFLKGLLK